MNNTTNYSKFTFNKCNRPVEENHVEFLVKKILQRNMLHLFPVIVNSSMEIMDGQHRVKAAERLGYEFYYIVDDKFDPASMISINNCQKKWTIETYLHYWKFFGNKNYIKFQQLLDKYNWSYATAICFLYRYGHNSSTKFKDGDFIYPEDYDTKILMETAYNIQQILLDKKTKPAWVVKCARFSEALKRIIQCPYVNGSTLIRRIENSPDKIYIAGNIQEYCIQILNIYNRGQKNRLKIIIDGSHYEIVK